jgi:cytochrome c oxidase subunit 2
MDLIPGQTNVMWISADDPGLYLGQCAEFCGTSHANMLIRVMAQSREDYTAWADAQRRPAQPDSAGVRRFQDAGCGACHRIAGTVAQGAAGPDLTHLGSRQTLAAGILPNTPEDMSRWLTDPSGVKPGVLMPAAGLDGDALRAMVSFLESLQ